MEGLFNIWKYCVGCVDDMSVSFDQSQGIIDKHFSDISKNSEQNQVVFWVMHSSFKFL